MSEQPRNQEITNHIGRVIQDLREQGGHYLLRCTSQEGYHEAISSGIFPGRRFGRDRRLYIYFHPLYRSDLPHSTEYIRFVGDNDEHSYINFICSNLTSYGKIHAVMAYISSRVGIPMRKGTYDQLAGSVCIAITEGPGATGLPFWGYNVRSEAETKAIFTEGLERRPVLLAFDLGKLADHGFTLLPGDHAEGDCKVAVPNGIPLDTLFSATPLCA